MQKRDALHSLTDDELLRRLSDLLSRSRRVEADLVAHIAEVDARRLYPREATPSMFAYATQVLHLSEHEAFLRIGVARASRQHPVLLEMLRDGHLHLSGIAKLAAHLNRENRDALLARAVHRSKRQIEELVAELTPLRCPRSNEMAFGAVEPRPARTEADAAQLGPDRVVDPAPASPAGGSKVTPVAPARYRVQFDASTELRDKLERLQALMRTSVPDGDLARIIDAAVSEKLERLESKRYGTTPRPRKTLAQTDPTPDSRYVPAAVRRAVYRRDGGRCTYREENGRRCTERHDLELHHRFPFALGADHNATGIALACGAHNRLMAERDFGRERVEAHRHWRAL